MSLEELIKKLSQAFEVEEDDLGGCLKKTDLTDLDDVIYAAFNVWSYWNFYPIHDRELIRQIVKRFDEETTNRMAYDAKHGVGAFDSLAAESFLPKL